MTRVSRNVRATACPVLLASMLAFAGPFERAEAQQQASDIWTGFHIGAHAGIGRARTGGIFDFGEIDAPGENEESVFGSMFQLNGALGGIQAGYSHALGRWVAGLEGDWTWVDLSDTKADPDPEFTPATDNATTDVNWIASLRGRIGYALDGGTLVYGTAGIAWADVTYTARDRDNGGIDAGSTGFTATGYVVGGGMEHAITNSFSVRLEGLYYGFDHREDTRTLNSDSDPGDSIILSDIAVMRVALNYRLGASPDLAPHGAAPGAQWQGFYIGGHAGAGRAGTSGVFDNSEIGTPGDTDDSVLGSTFNLEGALGGAQVGYNVTTGRFLIGGELDWTHLAINDRIDDPDAEVGGTDNAEYDLNWVASARARFGILSRRSLIYLTAGIAWADVTYTAVNEDFTPADRGSVDITGTGYVIGGGIEHALTDTLSLKIEGLHYGFDLSEDTSTLTLDSDPGDLARFDSLTTLRVGLNYRFGGN